MPEHMLFSVSGYGSQADCLASSAPCIIGSSKNMKLARLRFLALLLFSALPIARAQDNYEIQVYGADTVPPASTMVELHSNFTAEGSKTVQDGMLPTNHAEHETVEITQGINSWFETGFYIFTSIQPDIGWQWVGDHIRPRFRIPESWHWPVGVSLSNEIGYQRAAFSPDTWTWEIRPIVDKKIGGWYLSFNPTLDRSFHGPSVNQGVVFSPNAKFSYDFTRKIAGGLEYYGSLGPITGFDPLREQQQQIVPSIDLDLGPKWEFNFGVGVGVTGATDHLIIKCILGRRFSWRHGS
jgi:Putative MetA-pathway of phenol degradation